MSLRLRLLKYCLSILLGSVMLSSCHPALKQGYHDMCLHYNKYFIANEKMKELEKEIWKAHKDDYNTIIKMYPDCDSTLGKSLKSKTEEIIKKASLGIDWHGGVYWTRQSWNGYSKWADDAFIIIGKARMYSNDFKNAKETFKYVISKTKKEEERHRAMIWLANTYIRANELANASEVLRVLEKEKLERSNSYEYYLTKSYYHHAKKEWAAVNKYIQKAIPNKPFMQKREIRARHHFIAGQTYQLFNKDSSSYLNYNKTIKNNPPYELGFYARLYAAQVASVKDEKNNKKIVKYFKKLLKDPKNEEYKDKIYYELGKYELKQDHVPQAVEYWSLATKQKVQNPLQNGYTYLALAETHYTRLKAFQKSKYYYDSALVSLPKDYPDYRKIEKRKNILDEFVKHYDMMVLQDSLLKLAKLDTNALSKKLDQVIEKDFQRQKREFLAQKEAERRKEAAQKQNTNSPLAFPGGGLNPNTAGGSFYFYNPSTIAQGKSEFFRKWGDRKLEDNWRRSSKEKPIVNDAAPIDSIEAKIMEMKKDNPNAPKPDKDGFIGVKLDKKKLMEEIPLTDEKKAESDAKLLSSIYNLGKIYHFKLEELEDAKSYYEKLLKRYPDSKHEPEVLYMLRLICIELKNKACEDKYYQLLTENHPESDYAKMLVNPDWKKIAKKQKEIEQREYKYCLELYQNRQFRDADSMLVIFRTSYPDSELSDRADLLRTLIVGHSRLLEDYKKSLQSFIDEHPKSELIAHAKHLYESCEKMEKSDEYKKARVVDEEESNETEDPVNKENNNTKVVEPEQDKKKETQEKSILLPEKNNNINPLEDVDGQ